MKNFEGKQPRTSERPIQLVLRTMGGRKSRQAKIKRLIYALSNFNPSPERQKRLERMIKLGYADEIPTPLQLKVGSIDLLRFFIIPCAGDFYESRGIGFSFHVLLRLLVEPASLLDTTGFASHHECIIGHVMQVVHANPIYDLQLLRLVHDDPDWGLERLQNQVEDMIRGVHPRYRSISGIIEDPDYHEKLLSFLRKYRKNPDKVEPTELLRDNVVDNPNFYALQQIFGTVPAQISYFNTLPTTLFEASFHLLLEREMPFDHAL